MQRFGRLWYWVFDSAEFTSTEKLTFAALSLYQDNQKSCYPSIAELARVSSLGKSTVKRDIKNLEKKGAIKYNNRSNGHGKTSNIYHIVDSPPHRPTENGKSITWTGDSHNIDDPEPPRDHEQIYITDSNEQGGVPQKIVTFSPIEEFEKFAKKMIIDIETEATL